MDLFSIELRDRTILSIHYFLLSTPTLLQYVLCSLLVQVDEAVLADLKHLLIEAKQKVPPFLASIETEFDQMNEAIGDGGCAYCGGLGHRITACPKLEAVQHKKAGEVGKKDYLASNAADY